MTGKSYLAIDGDGHVIEADEMFQHYLAPAYRERATGFQLNRNNVRRIVFDGVEEPPFPLEISIRKPMEAANRIKVLDKEQIWAAVLFPSGVLTAIYRCPPDLCRAVVSAYNDWIRDYIAPFRDRLFFAAPVALHDVAWAIGEAQRAVRHGASAIVIRPNRAPGQSWSDAAYEPFYAAIQEMGVPLVFHETTGDPSTAGGDRYPMREPSSYAFNHVVSHSFEQMFAALSVICGGVLEKFPRLKILFAESGCSWVPYWLARLDDHADHRALGRYYPIKLRPSEYFRRQCWVTCDPHDQTLHLAVQGVGADRILFASDYPHFDSAGGAVGSFFANEGVSASDQRKILWDNVAAFYGITPPPEARHGQAAQAVI